MRLLSARAALFACSALFLAGLTQNAMATCAADINKVEYAVENAKRIGIDITDAERMRALLVEANRERKAGNETKCQELIDQAKRMGNVE